MDAKLAEIYGTNTPEEGDVEKLAAAELAEKLAGDESMDLSELEPEQIEALAAQVLAGEDGQSEDEEEEEKTAGDESSEKVAEADYLGRVMAHAYVQELRGIDKEAGVKDMAGKVGKFVADKARAAGGGVKKGATWAKDKTVAGAKKGYAGAKAGAKASKEHVGRNKGKYGLGAGAAAGAAGGYAAGKKKKASGASALDTLAEQRALEILRESGIDVDAEGEVKEASISEEQAAVLQQAVEARAVEMLEANGYTFQGEETEEETE
jgi:hypothetical protein